MDRCEDVNDLLLRADRGDPAAWDRLVQLVYPDLKRFSRSALNGRARHTLDTTALVHECYLRLSQAGGAPRDRAHLMALAVRIMRQVLVDHARERLAAKRGGGAIAIPVEDAQLGDGRQFETLIEIDAALSRLAALEPRQARVFECRYFGGLNDEETALAVGVSSRTARRDWDSARQWLAETLSNP